MTFDEFLEALPLDPKDGLSVCPKCKSRDFTLWGDTEDRNDEDITDHVLCHVCGFTASRPTHEIEESPMAPSTPTPFPLVTSPSGKHTKWGVPGSAETFPTKGKAQAFLDDTPAPEAPTTSEGRVLAMDPADLPPVPDTTPSWQDPEESRKPKPRAKKAKAPQADPEPGPSDDYFEGLTLVPSPGGRYDRLMHEGRSLGYLYPRPRPGRARRLEVLTKRLEGAPKGILKDTTPRQAQTVIMVTRSNEKQAKALLDYAKGES